MLPVAQLVPIAGAATALPAAIQQAAGAFSEMFHASVPGGIENVAGAQETLKNITPSRLEAGGLSREDAVVHETLRQSAEDALHSIAGHLQQALQAAGISIQDLKFEFGPGGVTSNDPKTQSFLKELEANSPGITDTLNGLYNNLKAMGAVDSQQDIQLRFEGGRLEVFTAE